MALNPLINKVGVIVVDANVAIAVTAREVVKEAQARAALAYYSSNGYLSFAPGVIVSETLFVLCGQEQRLLLSPPEYAQAVADFHAFIVGVLPPPNGEASLDPARRPDSCRLRVQPLGGRALHRTGQGAFADLHDAPADIRPGCAQTGRPPCAARQRPPADMTVA